MTFIKNTVYSALAFGLALAPALAHAQWSTGQSNAASAQLPGGTIIGIIKTGMNYLLAILGFIGIIAFVISGILYLTAAGDEKRAEKAKNAMTAAITGVIVALIGFVIIQAVNVFLQGNSTNF